MKNVLGSNNFIKILLKGGNDFTNKIQTIKYLHRLEDYPVNPANSIVWKL